MKRLAAISLFVIAGAFGVARGQAPSSNVLCKDGSTALAGPTACADHGGVVGEGASVTRAKAGMAITEAQERKQAGAGTEPKVLCSDGTITNAGEGACRYNGGIDRAAPAEPFQATRTKPRSFYPKAELQTPAATPMAAATPAAVTPAPSRPRAAARCHDGTLSYEGYVIDACLDHGGVAEWYRAE
jgi:hypothetical protein